MKQVKLFLLGVIMMASSSVMANYNAAKLEYNGQGELMYIEQVDQLEMKQYLAEHKVKYSDQDWEICQQYVEKTVAEELVSLKEDDIIHQKLTSYIYIEGAFPIRWVCIKKGSVTEDWDLEQLEKNRIDPQFNLEGLKTYKLFPNK